MAKQMVRYPWDRWLQKKQVTLHKGRDFRCMPHSMGVQVRTAAARRGKHVSVFIQGTTLVVKVEGANHHAKR
jgi:hypothetical protein